MIIRLDGSALESAVNVVSGCPRLLLGGQKTETSEIRQLELTIIQGRIGGGELIEFLSCSLIGHEHSS